MKIISDPAQPFGYLFNATTHEQLRPATREELVRSVRAEEEGDGTYLDEELNLSVFVYGETPAMRHIAFGVAVDQIEEEAERLADDTAAYLDDLAYSEARELELIAKHLDK